MSYRLGRIISQYENLNTNEEKFEATLYISVLQNLVANCNEYIRKMIKSEIRNYIFKLNYATADWGINHGSWIKNTFGEEESLQNFISRIRNAVSHPTPTDITSEYPSTGFTTVPDNSGIIKKYRFINSPDTKENCHKVFQSSEEAKSYIERNSLSKYNVEINSLGKHKFFLFKNDMPFTRQSIIDLTVKELGVFVKNLTNYLAQPTQPNWDGSSIIQLISAA